MSASLKGNLLSLLITLLCVFSSIGSVRAVPLEIRFTAAAFTYMSDTISNTTFEFASHRTGFDIVWRGELVGSTFIPDGAPLILSASGTAYAAYSDGNGNCSAELNRQENGSVFPVIREVSGDTVKMKIALPHTASNNGTTAFLMNANTALDCRTAKNPFLSGSHVQSTCVFNPRFDTPGGPESCVGHGTDAYFEFSASSRTFSSPFVFTFDATEFSSIDSSILRRHKIVWFGSVKVRPAKGDTPPATINPFNQFGYVPPLNSVDVPGDAPQPGSGGGDYNPGDVLRWYRNVWRGVSDGVNSARNSLAAASAHSSVDRDISRQRSLAEASFDPATGNLSIPGDLLEAPPHSGTLKIHLTLKKPEEAAGFQAKVVKAALANELQTGVSSDLILNLNQKTRRSLASRKPFTAFLAFEFTPSEGKKAKKSFKFNIKKIKK